MGSLGRTLPARGNLAAALARSQKAERSARAAARRLEAKKARTDMREWVVQRRERTRHLIELGGRVVKAGLVDLTDDDRATLYGALLDCAGRLQGEDRDRALALWKRRGKRAFEADADSPKNNAVGDRRLAGHDSLEQEQG